MEGCAIEQQDNSVEAGDRFAEQEVSSGIYESRFKLKSGDVVLDLGAHVGHFTKYASSVVGDSGLVLAFEPHPLNFNKLIQKSGSNVIPFRLGAFNRPGVFPLYENTNQSDGHSMMVRFATSLEIMCVDIGPFLCSLGVVPNFIKIDTEGAEVEIITSLLLAGVRGNMVFESHTYPRRDDCEKLLIASGYKVFKTDKENGVNYAVHSIDCAGSVPRLSKL